MNGKWKTMNGEWKTMNRKRKTLNGKWKTTVEEYQKGKLTCSCGGSGGAKEKNG